MATSEADPTPRELLVLCESAPAAAAPLRDAMSAQGVHVDIVDSLEALREAFLQRGGHDGLAVTDRVKPQLATDAAESLRALDPDLRIVAFGHGLDRASLPEGAVRLRDFHPSSRAGIGALARAMLP